MAKKLYKYSILQLKCNKISNEFYTDQKQKSLGIFQGFFEGYVLSFRDNHLSGISSFTIFSEGNEVET